tara:strand:+ start:142 stop:696 length:555 start_codon:yes stop_codon:yes gene_type:complete
MKICVVGNSPNLLETNYGDVIDSHDVIIRCNRYILDGYEKHVGSRTDYRVVNCHFWKKKDTDSHGKHFSEWDNSRKILETEMIVCKDQLVTVREAKGIINFVSESVEFARKHNYGNNSMTAGGCAILFAGSYLKAEHINCYGFSKNYTGNCTHYFEEVTNKKISHDHQKELTELSNLYGVTFYD